MYELKTNSGERVDRITVSEDSNLLLNEERKRRRKEKRGRPSLEYDLRLRALKFYFRIIS